MTAAQSLAPRILHSIGEIAAADWNALQIGGSPFLRHEFLCAVEDSGSACEATGWSPRHVVLEDEKGHVCAAMPLYLKDHSWGEFVFDHAWAQAYERTGRDYYPRLVSCVPFTPISGPRLLLGMDAEPQSVCSQLLEACQNLADSEGASSVHVLFPPRDATVPLSRAGLMLRKDCQYHWQNRGYGNFGEFLALFRADKRKKVKRERRRVAEAGIDFRVVSGTEISPALLDQVYLLHAGTFLERGQRPYLTRRFFAMLHQQLPSALVLFLALDDGVPVACAICLRDESTLYGRYWGCNQRYHSLHFETCFYRGIDYCIEHKLERFEPGAQGEHKLRRGFEPSLTWSAHWLRDPGFAAAVDDYLTRERAWMDDYIHRARDQLPFRRDGNDQPTGPA